MSRVNPWKITGYKAGQNVVCKVSHAEPGGYAVIIPKDNLPGFLPTEQPLKAGEEVLAQYVCVSNSRILLQCRFGTNNKPGAPRRDTVKWEEQLDQINAPLAPQLDYQRPSETVNASGAQEQYQENYQQAAYAQEFDIDPAQQNYQQGQYQYTEEQYATNYGEHQGQFQQGQQDQSQYQNQYDQTQYDQGQYGQNQFDQNQLDQNQYGQNQYDHGQHTQSQTGQQNFENSQSSGYAPSEPQGFLTGGYAPAQDYSQNNQYQNATQAGSQPDYNQSQNSNINPQSANGTNQPGVPTGGFATQQSGGMQFRPSLPADYAEAPQSWSAPPDSAVPPSAQGNSGFGQMQGQNSYQASVQSGVQYQGMQQAPPVSYQGPNTDSARPYQPHVQTSGAGGFQSLQGAPIPASSGHYEAGAGAPPQASYQSPGSYQGPSQAQPLAPYAPVIIPDETADKKSAERIPADEWGYAGQGWDADNRLNPAVAAAPGVASSLPALPTAPIPAATDAPASEADEAFRVWAPHVPTRDFHLKRATDLVPPAFDPESLAVFTSEEQDIEWLITDIEGGMRTGCVKAVSQTAMSRSAALLYKGRAVGCIYGRKQQTQNYGTEQSLQIMMQDLEKADTAIQLYDLPESVVLPMSALFLGYPVPREENVDARTYMDYMCNWFESKSQTACLAINFPSKQATSLCFIHEGKFCGAFYVEEQKFSDDKEFVYALMKGDPQASVEANILPPEMTSSAVRFGFNLSMARKKGY
jgi:hypothetical protein